jgi:hypothetical protein
MELLAATHKAKASNDNATSTVFDATQATVSRNSAADRINGEACASSAADEFVPDGPEMVGVGGYRSPGHMRPPKSSGEESVVAEPRAAHTTATKFERRRLSTSDAMEGLSNEQKQQLGMATE